MQEIQFTGALIYGILSQLKQLSKLFIFVEVYRQPQAQCQIQKDIFQTFLDTLISIYNFPKQRKGLMKGKII